MARAIAALAVLWPLAQAATVAAALAGAGGTLTALVPIAASRVCHQRPERSFHTHGVQWPVCARCSGLYLGAAGGVWLGFAQRLRSWTRDRRVRMTLAIASLPTVMTWAAEWALGLPVTNIARAVAALPLGAAVAAVIVAVTAPAVKPIR
jgi:uncharacterized membrane protein